MNRFHQIRNANLKNATKVHIILIGHNVGFKNDFASIFV